MIELTVYCMISRNDKFSIQAIKSILASKINANIKLSFSIEKRIYNDIKEKINFNSKKINIIQYEDKFINPFEHIKYLINLCKTDYIMILHDDDNIGLNFLNSSYNNIIKYTPDALSSSASFIDQDGRTNVYLNSIKSKDKVYKISKRKVLNRYFLPFRDGENVFPTIAFKTALYKKYWEDNTNYIGTHEDVKIVYYFASKNNFYENGLRSNFFYRYHSKQESSKKLSYDRKQLINWITSLNENFLYKLTLLFFAKLQYLIYFKNYNLGNNKLNNLIKIVRLNIQKFRNKVK